MTAVTLTARTDRSLIRPHARSQRFVLVELTAPPAAQVRERRPVNLSFVIDRSGSMSGGKLELAKQAVLDAIDRLDPKDRFSVVMYDDEVQLVAESSPATATAKRDAAAAVRGIGPGGSTNLSGGWFAGSEQVALRLDDGAGNRCLLLTDGLANRGITNPDELTGHVTALRERGVSTTTFGVGNDFDEVLLQAMADAGGGHFYYIADGAQIRDHIASEVGETLEVTARDVAVEIVHPEGVRVEAISPQRVESRGSRTIVTVGDLVADQMVEVVLRLTFPYGDLGRETGVIVALAGAAGETQERLAWTYADDAANDRQVRDIDVDRAVARQFAARARQEAVLRNKATDYIKARWALQSTAEQIRRYMHRDPELRALVDELESEAQTFSAPMPASMLKRVHFASVSMARSRDAAGRAMKREP
jgi:Ca-activated chloride channel family protein